jgi:hypothetical protein
MNILEKHLTLVVAAKEVDDDPPPKNFIVVAVDMLDALCGALEGSFEAFLAADRAKLMPMVLYCIQVSRNLVPVLCTAATPVSFPLLFVAGPQQRRSSV